MPALFSTPRYTITSMGMAVAAFTSNTMAWARSNPPEHYDRNTIGVAGLISMGTDSGNQDVYHPKERVT